MGKASGRRVCERGNIKDDRSRRNAQRSASKAVSLSSISRGEEESGGSVSERSLTRPWKEYLRKAGAMASSRYPLRGEFREENF